MLTFIMLVFGVNCFSQIDLFKKIKDELILSQPNLKVEDKVIAVNFWTSSSIESRNSNKEFERVSKTFENALLKGGSKGIVCVCVNVKNENAEIILKKDDITKLISIKLDDIKTSNLKNIVFDSNGNATYKNLNSDKIFSSVQQLITR